MKTCIQTLSIMAIAASLSYGQDAPKEKKEHKRPEPEAIFKKLDKDNNGSLSLDEFKASPRGQKDPAKAEEIFKKMDADSNGAVTLEEFKAFHRERRAKEGKGHKGGEAPPAN